VTWQNAFDLGPQTVKVWAGGAGAWDWTGTLSKGGSESFTDPVSSGNTLTVSVDSSGVVTLETDAGAFTGRHATVVVGVPLNSSSARVVGVLSAAPGATAQQVYSDGTQDGFALSGGSATNVWMPNPADASRWPLALMGADASWIV
jgi:hypothetical protein